MGPVMSCICATMLFLQLGDNPQGFVYNVYTWFSVGGLHVPVEFWVDRLSGVMIMIVPFVGSLIHIYSVGYMSHEPHGTVANNLLKQPATFLCLRCHTGHRTQPGHPGFGGMTDVGTNAGLQKAFYGDCTQCHMQVHGSDLPSVHLPKGLLR